VANKDFDRVVINPRERPLSTDIVQGSSQGDNTLRDLISAFTGGLTGFVSDGFYPTAVGAAALQVTLKAGFGFLQDGTYPTSAIGGITGLNDLSPYVPMYLSQDISLVPATAPGVGQERYDLIEVKPNRRLADQANRDIINTITGVFAAQNVFKTLAFNVETDVGTVISPAPSTNSVSIKQGVAAATGTAVVPTGTAGYTTVGVIYVANGAANFLNCVRDMRPIIPGMSRVGSLIAGFLDLTGVPDGLGAPIVQTRRAASLKFGIKGLGAGPNTGVRLYLIWGDTTNRTIHLDPKVVAAGRPDIIAQIVASSSGALSGADATALQGAPSSLDVAPGQPYVAFDIIGSSITSTAIGSAVAMVFNNMLSFT